MKHLNKFLENSGDKLIKVYNFKDIYKAIQFVKKACDIFNELNHHPDYFCLEGNNVTIHLSTHSVGGVTQKDWDVVTQLNTLLKD